MCLVRKVEVESPSTLGSRTNRGAAPGTSIVEQAPLQFGGTWTIRKLEILTRYLDAYTTALKHQPFRLIYIDAFAGGGHVLVQTEDQEASQLIHGSAERAVGIGSKPFDRLIFVDTNRDNHSELEILRARHPDRDIRPVQSNANAYLQQLGMEWRSWRGVVFLDPFATQVDWSTIERIAGFNALDMWLLFPTSAIARLLPLCQRPDDIVPAWAECLTRVYGDESWRDLYRRSRQLEMFKAPGFERDRGVDDLMEIYQQNLKVVFGERLMNTSRTLRNHSGTPIFELIFCVGNSSGIGPAKRIAGHILDHM